MNEAQAITELKARHQQLEKRMQETGIKQSASIVKLSERLQPLLESIESAQEKQKSTWNPAAETRMKFMKKGIKLGKELNHFDADIAKEYGKGNLSKETVEKFVSIIVHIRQSRISAAKDEFAYFEGIIELNKNFESAKDELEKKDSMLRREIKKIKNLLADISDLDKISIDPEKVQMHENLLKRIAELEELRADYLSSLVSKQVAQLLVDAEDHPMKDQWPDYPAKTELVQLRDFFSQYKELGQYTVSQLCELFNYSEKRLSHIVPETSLFRKTVLINRKWFETMNDLEHTSFLAIDIENEPVLDFFAEKINGAKEIIEQIRKLAIDSLSFKEEFEKNRKFQERKKELSRYSKNKLEAELAENESLLELLHSELKEEKKEEGPDLFSRISSFFKS
jgi:hypothetical protein